MSKLDVFDMKGARVGGFDFADDVLKIKRGGQAVHDAVVAHLAACRAGTASTLRKGEVAGSNKKPWRQKGTGRARAGLRQSPVWRGGGVAFGPHPRSYDVKINRKVAKLAFKRIFSDKVDSGEVSVVEKILLTDAKTKSFAALMKALKTGSSVLFLVDKTEKNMEMASRNIPGVRVMRVSDADVYTLMRYSRIVLDKAGAETVLKRLDGGKAGDQ
jgi:large subunit ribosomal protein L4